MSGFPHNVLHPPAEDGRPPPGPGLSSVHRSSGSGSGGGGSGGHTQPSGDSGGSVLGSNEYLVASPSRDEYAGPQFHYHPSSSSADQIHRRDSAGSSAGSRPSTTASLNPTMQQLSTADRLSIVNTTTLPTLPTLPPLRSVMHIGRPASASESAGSAMTAANTLIPSSVWEQNRPRAASASSFTSGQSHRGSYLAGRYERSILNRSALPDRYPYTGIVGSNASLTSPSAPALTWSGSLRTSRAGPNRARSQSRPEPYAVPSGAPGFSSAVSTASNHRSQSTLGRTHSGLAAPSIPSRLLGTGGASTSFLPALGMAPGEVSSLSGFSREENGKRYKLVVAQSPSRARMCGFGDKDRRPLSPTLIVKLVITDVATGKEVPPTSVDTSAYFLAADLVHPEELKASPRNLLIHQHTATIAADVPPPSAATGPSGDAASTSSATFDVDRVRARSLSDPWKAAQVTLAPSWGGGSIPHSAYASNENLYSSSRQQQQHDAGAPSTTVMTETYTRNFVGSSVASANILKDEHDQLGIFFVLQDLSVRTEGTYRIKLMFADLSTPTAPSPTNSPSLNASRSDSPGERQMKSGTSEALAETYTEPFVVYTPRRFPGVIEPTMLSRKFAAQGVKIPVRVDRKKRRKRDGAAMMGADGEAGANGSGLDEGDGDEDNEED